MNVLCDSALEGQAWMDVLHWHLGLLLDRDLQGSHAWQALVSTASKAHGVDIWA